MRRKKNKRKKVEFQYVQYKLYELFWFFFFSLEKRKKKKQSLDDMPPAGPFVTKIHLFDNGIDYLQADGFALIQRTISAYARLVFLFRWR